MINSHGLTHIALAVRDPDVSAHFYAQVFGMEEYFRDELSIHVRRPPGHAAITFVRDPSLAGRSGGILHFGFRLHAPGEIEVAAHELEKAGGKILRQGEFAPGFPYLFATDPDGYEIEVWYE
jgi:catechol 2,3-dioxygenase-like lactoylglutathione lyase family enzyme